MRRRVMLITVLLISGGAVVNVAVAWACSVRNPERHASSCLQTISIRREAESWSSHSKDVFPDSEIPWCRECKHLGTRIRSYFAYRVYTGFVTPEEVASRELAGPTTGISSEECGLPMNSLRLENWAPSESPFIHDGFVVGDLTLPRTPVWPGFAINTIFYAAILWVLFFVPGGVRRMIRRRRGLCPACAYPVGTSPVCTECGKVLRKTQ